MPDNLPPAQPDKSGIQPPLPSSGQTAKAPTTQLPRIKKPGVGKIVVMLSSVAKSPATQLLPKMPVSSTAKLPSVVPPAATPPPGATTVPPGAVPLPPKQVTPASLAPELAQSPLSTTTYVRLPPKTAVPRLNLITGPQPATPVPPAAAVPTPAPVAMPTPTPLPEIKPAAHPVPRKPGAQHIPPIRLGDMGGNTSELPGESILLGPTETKSAEIKPAAPSAPLKPATPPTPAPVADTPAKSSSLVAPPLMPPRQSVQTTQPMKGTSRSFLPKPGSLPSVTGKITVPSTTLPAPPLTPPGRLPQPNAPAAPDETRPTPLLTRSTTALPKPAPIPSALSGRLPELRPPPTSLPSKPSEPPAPSEAAKPAPPSSGGTTPTSGVHRVPAMIQPDLPSTDTTARAPGPKPAAPPAKPVIKLSGELRKSTPLVLSSTSKIPLPNVAEVRAALRPPALPRRTTPLPVVAKQETVAPAAPVTPPVTPSVAPTPPPPLPTPTARPVEPVTPPPLPPPLPAPVLREPAAAAPPPPVVVPPPVVRESAPAPTPAPVVAPPAPSPEPRESAPAPTPAPVDEPAAPPLLKAPESAPEVVAKAPQPVEPAKVSGPSKPPVLPPKPQKPVASPKLPALTAEVAPAVSLLDKPSPPVELEKPATPPLLPVEPPKSAVTTAKPPPLPPPLPAPATVVGEAKSPEPVLLKDLPAAAAKSDGADKPPAGEKPAPPIAAPSIIEPPMTSPKPVDDPMLVAEAKSSANDVAPVVVPTPAPETAAKPAKLPPPLPVTAPVPVSSLLVKSTALPSSKTRMLAKPVEPAEPVKAAEPTKAAEAVKPAGPAKPIEPAKAKVAEEKPSALPPPLPVAEKKLPPTRAERAARRALVSGLIFYLGVLPATLAALFFGTIYFGRDTRVEGQVIPPPGTMLGNEVWIVTDFRSLAAGVADDLARDRAPKLQDITEKQDHVQRAQADIATRESRIRLMQQQMDDTRKQIDDVVKQSRDATQQLWDTDGAEIDAEYTDHVNGLQQAIADRAKSLKLNYQPDPAFPSPEVWANAYRLALYQVPPGVDSLKEHQWLGDQMKAWRDFQKSLDDRKEQLREKAAALKLAPAPKIADLNAKIDDLQQRMDSTAAEEVPLKTELVQAQADLLSAQDALASADDKYMKELLSLPDVEVSHTRIPLAPDGRFTWVVDPDSFGVDQKTRHYWIFSRATRPDGRQYWALHDFDVQLNKTVVMMIEPGSYISTKAILRPDLSPEEQDQ